MDNAGYTSLTRQSGLLKEMQTVANNIANISTTGYRREGVIFSEMVQALDAEGGSISMAQARGRMTDTAQGALAQTGGTFDFAIEGSGFFSLETPDGQRLTRSGSFTPNGEGELVTMDGHRVLDAGGAAIFIPPDAQNIALAPDGTLSADGRPLAQLGIVEPVSALNLIREGGTSYRVDGEVLPTENPAVLQGFLEGSNVDPVTEMARMIEVQHAYELGQKFLEKEDERIRSVIRVLGQ